MKLLQLFTLLFIITSFSCAKETENIIDTSAPVDEFEVTNSEGTVSYWDANGLNKYTINVYIEGTIDGLTTGIVDDLPEDFRTVGLSVIFSGKYEKSSDNPQPILGGQSVYSLTLSSIELK